MNCRQLIRRSQNPARPEIPGNINKAAKGGGPKNELQTKADPPKKWMRREPRIDEPSDSDDDQDSEKLPTSTIGKIRNEPFEIMHVGEKSLSTRLNGQNAIKRTTKKQRPKDRVNDQ